VHDLLLFFILFIFSLGKIHRIGIANTILEELIIQCLVQTDSTGEIRLRLALLACNQWQLGLINHIGVLHVLLTRLALLILHSYANI